MQVEFSISGVKPAPRLLPDQSGNQSAVAMLPIGGQLAVAGENAVIQFYDAARDKHLEKLQVRLLMPLNNLSNIAALPTQSSIWPPHVHIFHLELLLT